MLQELSSVQWRSLAIVQVLTTLGNSQCFMSSRSFCTKKNAAHFCTDVQTILQGSQRQCAASIVLKTWSNYIWHVKFASILSNDTTGFGQCNELIT